MKKYQSVSALILCALFSVAALADEKAGLKNGDVIQEVDGNKAGTPEQTLELVGAPKTPKKLKIIRNGAKKTVEQK